EALKLLLEGAPGPYRDIVLLNAAAALLVADRVSDLVSGVALAVNSIDQGKASAVLTRLVEITNREVPA
ncbi:MAG TPA: anthranilate phosphoribosyltransferase, partial [Rhodospirillaceae bacterium]|nr:anthranilate phosphoribosyltransferase [Rhodospirillaceae bacterium]